MPVCTHLLAECRTHCHPRLQDCAWCARRLAQAAELYRGELLEGFFLDSQPFEEWLLVRRENLRSQALEALYDLAQHALLHEDYLLAQRYARRQLEIDAWREEAHYQLMYALALAGQRSAALAQYETCAHVLESELGAEPGDELRDLYGQLLSGRRLQPEAAAVPNLQPAGFPVPATPLIGRQVELAQVEAALDDPGCHLLTLTGPGGIGKTRLAIQAGIQQAGLRRHGAFFVPLAGVAAPEFLAPAIANAICFTFHGRQDPLAQLLDYLSDKEMLLVLDNFEHLLPAAAQVEAIQARSPGVTLLVTSRQRLDLPGEHRLSLSGLSFPPNGANERQPAAPPEGYSAVLLFNEIAARQGANGRTSPGHQEQAPSVARICRLVEGLPLGIELAAAWLRLLSPQEIAAEIERDLGLQSLAHPDLPERHRSLPAVFDTSWRLLAEDERRVLSSLSILPGGFTLQTGREVAGATPRLLLGLVDKSLLHRRSEAYFEIGELLRQYLQQRLSEQPEWAAQAYRRRSACYLAFVLQRRPGLEQALQRGERPQALLDEFNREKDNLQASWQYLLGRAGEENAPFADVEAYVDGLGLFYAYQGWSQEAARLYELALDWEAACYLGSPGAGAPVEDPAARSFLRARWEYDLGKAYLTLAMLARGLQQVKNSIQRLGQRLPASALALRLGLLGQVLTFIFLRLLPDVLMRRMSAALPTRSAHIPSRAERPTAYSRRAVCMQVQRAFNRLAEISYLSNQRQHGFYYALRVLNLREGQAASPQRAHAEANFCLGTGVMGMHRLAAYFYRQARQSAQNLQDAQTSAYVFQMTGMYDIGLGRWESAQQALRYAAGIYERMGSLRQWGECLMPQTVIASALGQTARMVELLDLMEIANQQSNAILQQGWVFGGRAHLDLMSGRPEPAIPALQRYLEISRRVAYSPGVIMAYGLLSLAYLRQNEHLLARQAAEAAAQQIQHSFHTVFTNTEGYSAAVETCLGLIEGGQYASAEERLELFRQARGILAAWRTLVRGVPAGWGRYWLHLGSYHWLSGARKQAFQYWRKSLAESKRLQMPYDQGRACYEIGRHLPPGDPQRRGYMQRACDLLGGMGEAYYCQLARGVLAE